MMIPERSRSENNQSHFKVQAAFWLINQGGGRSRKMSDRGWVSFSRRKQSPKD